MAAAQGCRDNSGAGISDEQKEKQCRNSSIDIKANGVIMWGIFLESVAIFKNYMGYYENGYLAGIFLLALLYLWMTEKDKCRRALLVYVPTVLLALFFCPLFRKAFVGILDDSGTYYRILWLLQMSIVSAYAILRLCRRHPRIGAAAACIVIAVCGNYVYDSQHITPAENLYHLPQEAIDVADAIDTDEGAVMVLMPEELIHFVRQYDTNIWMPYGREVLIPGWDYTPELYLEMERSEVIHTAALTEKASEYFCSYIVLKEDRKTDEPLTQYGYVLQNNVSGYLIYRNQSLSASAEDEGRMHSTNLSARSSRPASLK